VFYTPLAYAQYLMKARNSHALHAPFLYALYSDVIAIQKRYYAFGALDALRLALMQDIQQINVQDLGAGSKRMRHVRSIGQIARYSAVSKKEGELLFRLVNEFSPHTILELGTSLGLSTLYMAEARRQAHIHTMEGCPETARVAQQNFDMLGAKNIQVHVGNIEQTLPALLTKIPAVDLAYLDANHQYEPTMRYFEQILPCLSSEALLIFDDIHWSKGMHQAWTEIVRHPEITISLDLFSFGIAFVSKKLSKEHFVLKF